MTQAEGLRQALERHRTSLGKYAGSLYWSMNDVWPAVSWSTVDHAGRWKLGHHAAKRANAPRTVLWERASEDSLRFQAFNDHASSATGRLHVQCKTMDGVVLKDTSVTWRCPPMAWRASTWGPWHPGVKSPETATWLAVDGHLATWRHPSAFGTVGQRRRRALARTRHRSLRVGRPIDHRQLGLRADGLGGLQCAGTVLRQRHAVGTPRPRPRHVHP